MPPLLTPTRLLAVLQPWAEIAEPIHRRLAQLVDVTPGQEVLWVGCGAGRSVFWWVSRFETHVHGVDPDPAAIELAERTARAAGLATAATFQTADPTNLPHEAAVFDVAIANLLYLPGFGGEHVLRDCGRVARPMSTIAALVPTWLATPEPDEAEQLERLGIHPRFLMQWKGYFREAGIVELAVEDPAPDVTWLAPGWVGLLVRAWRAAHWSGVRFVVGRGFRTLRSLAVRRVVGISLVKGTRWPHA
jgi:SAM-dependent methyltransferase